MNENEKFISMFSSIHIGIEFLKQTRKKSDMLGWIREADDLMMIIIFHFMNSIFF